MIRETSIFFIVLCLVFWKCGNQKNTAHKKNNQSTQRIVQVKIGIESDQISETWKKAIQNRVTKSDLDSLSKLTKEISTNERQWIQLIQSKTKKWNALRDSLQVPFENIVLNDTIYVLLGYQGGNDGFTYQHNTVCFDVASLYKAYGSAQDSINSNRIDRIYSHEFTHLLHKAWKAKSRLKLTNFKDSVLWECIYEGMGMYRSMSSRWFPQKGQLSSAAQTAFKNLYPKFTHNIIDVLTKSTFSDLEKKKIKAHLSRGSLNKKWGAMPVAVWLALESQGDDKNLIQWINKGPETTLLLGNKYLKGKNKEQFAKVVQQQ